MPIKATVLAFSHESAALSQPGGSSPVKPRRFFYCRKESSNAKKHRKQQSPEPHVWP